MTRHLVRDDGLSPAGRLSPAGQAEVPGLAGAVPYPQKTLLTRSRERVP